MNDKEIRVSDPMLEALASLEHDQWMDWAKNLMEKEPGLSQERKERWQKFMIPYCDLDEAAKDMDRVWAAKAVDIALFHRQSMGLSFKAVVQERDMLTQVIDNLQTELRVANDEKFDALMKLKAVEERINKLQSIVKDFFAAQLDSRPQLD